MIDDLVGDLFTTVRRETVHEDSVRLRSRKQLAVYLEGTKYLAPLFCLLLLPHACPGIGVDDIGAGYSLPWIVCDGATAPGLASAQRSPDDCVGFRLVLGWARDPNVRTELSTREHQGVRDIVSVTDKSDLETGNPALVLPHGQEVGHSLARMAVVGQAVDDGNTGICGHVFDNIVGKRSDHDALHHALKVLGNVVNRFSLSQVDF